MYFYISIISVEKELIVAQKKSHQTKSRMRIGQGGTLLGSLTVLENSRMINQSAYLHFPSKNS